MDLSGTQEGACSPNPFHIEVSSAVLPAPDLLTPDSNPLLPSLLLPSWGPGLRV